jgi:hypothetical protein
MPATALVRTGARSHPSGLTRRARFEQLKQALLTERSSFDAHWRELGEYFLPRRTRFFVQDRNKGDRRSQKIIDSGPRFAARTLASGLHAGLTSPARPWMKLETPDQDLNTYTPVKEWLHVVTQRMLALFEKSNLYNVLPVSYGDMGVFGTAAMSELEDFDSLARFYSYPIGSYVVGLDHRGMPSTFIREYQLTVEQCVEAFGVVGSDPRDVDWATLSTQIRDAWHRGDYQAPVDITWIVTKNTDAYAPGRLEARYRYPFRSCHYESGRGDADFRDGYGLLRESGFRQFPILVPRWDVTGEDTYGVDSPGITTLGDTKQLQEQQRVKAKAIAKAVDPPLKGPHELRTQKVSLTPGTITYLEDPRVGGPERGLSPIHEVRLEGLAFLIQDMNETRQRVSRGFYEDLFLMLAMSPYGQRGGAPITAREVQERHEEKLLALGPVLERLNDELLDPLIERTFGIMLAVGGVPPPPPELEGMDLRVEYVSILAQAQKLVGVSGHDRFIQTAMAMAQVWPDVRHKVHAFRTVDDYAQMLGVDPHVVREDDEAEALAAAEQQAAQQAQQAETFAKMAQGSAALGQTPVNGGTSTALDQLTSMTTPGALPGGGGAV